MTRNNLPVQLTSFIGREREIEELKSTLSATRMLTLTGSGGCGKTRLAIRVASELGDEYVDGVWLVDLANVRDRDLVPGAFASTLGVQDQSARDPVQHLIGRLQDARALVVVDNCEHLIAAVAELSEPILRGCARLSLLATSREPLGLPGETTWRVPSLSSPEEKSSPDVDALMGYEAVRLFVDRALKVRPNFRITDENASAVARICSRLDGIPLAVELAAARVKVLTPHQIAEGLADRFHLLTGGSRVVMPRQQTLQASVDWSYQLLTENEKVVLDGLSVFAGGFTLDAAEAVCTDDAVGSNDVLDILERLVDKSLVAAEVDEGPAARYRMLETIRQFAMERLVENDRVKHVRTRHMEYFLGSGEPSLEDPETPLFGVPHEMRLEVENFRAAMRWARAGDDATVAVRLGTQLGRILVSVGLRNEALSLLRDVLSSADGASPLVLARAWTLRGWTVLWLHVEETPLECGEKALRFAEVAGDERATQAARTLIAQVAISMHHGVSAEAATAEMQRHAVSPSERIHALCFKAAHLLTITELEQANEVFEEAVALARHEDSPMLGTALVHFGYVALLQGDLEAARALADEAAESNRRNDDLDPRTFELSGVVHLWRGEFAEAKQRFEESLEVSRERQLASFEGCDLAYLTLTALVQGDMDAVVERFRAYETLGMSFDFEPDSRLDPIFFGTLCRVVHVYDNRREIFQRVIDTSVHPDDDLIVAIASHQLATILRDQDPDQVDALAFEALQAFRRFGTKMFVVESLELVAGLAADQESYREAARLFGAAEVSRRELNYGRFPIDQQRRDADVVRIEEALAGEFSDVWDEGASMTLDEAVDYALRGRGQRKRPSAGWAALTPAELNVSTLIAEGLSNPMIAERLFISRHTVETHLKNIYAKLGISSRAQLAGEAVRRNLTPEATETSKR
jgi:predicted ATPase/DNA-binding CsgD family transcriptional regulator/Tfp pilus assembly protein PilF